MSVSDPLIKDVKGCVQQFLNLSQSNTPISDNNLYFLNFAQTFEKILNEGLITQQNTKFFDRTIDAYSWMVGIINNCENFNSGFSYTNCVDLVRDRQDARDNCGKLRILIKSCLMRRCLHVPIETLMNSQHAKVFYNPNSILGDEILTQILLSVLLQVSKIQFNLNLENASFLDSSWCIPEIVSVELVPCSNLGMTISFSGNRAVIVEVQSNSVTAENGNILIGDILDSLNDNQITSKSKGKLQSLMRGHRLKPIKIRIVKAYQKESGQMYGPIQKLLQDLKLDLNSIKKQYEENGNEIVINRNKCFYGYVVQYLGNINMGDLGSVKQVQKAIKTFTEPYSVNSDEMKKVDQSAVLEIGEIGLKIREKESNKLIFEHAYMKIASCGNIPTLPKVFGYCAGTETCDIEKHFLCYIFEAAIAEEADLILQSIGQGFHRTHYAV